MIERANNVVWLLAAAVLVSLAPPLVDGAQASPQIIRSHPMARRQSDCVYTINYFKPDGTVVSERFMGKLAMAQDRADRAVADGTAQRAQVRHGKSGNVVYRA